MRASGAMKRSAPTRIVRPSGSVYVSFTQVVSRASCAQATGCRSEGGWKGGGCGSADMQCYTS